MVEVSTSILNVKKDEATKTFYNLETAKTDYFHIDIMDGKFVDNNTLIGMKEYSTILKQITNIPLDMHFMTYFVKDNIEQFIDFKPNIITFHIEAVKSKQEVYDLINYIKNNNARVGISIKPGTKIEEIYEFLPFIHLVLVMTVEPGLGGQKFMPDMMNKVKKLREYIKEKDLQIDIEVDGGINDETSKIAVKSGVDILVSGSYIINSNDYKEVINNLKKDIE